MKRSARRGRAGRAGGGDARRGRAGGRRLAGASPPPALHLSLPPPPPPRSLAPSVAPHRPRAGWRPGWPRPELLTWQRRRNSRLGRLYRRRRRRRKKRRRRHSGIQTPLAGPGTGVGEGAGRVGEGGRAEQTLRYRQGQQRRRRLHRRRRHHTNKDADWAAAKRLDSALTTRHDAHWRTLAGYPPSSSCSYQ